MTERNNPIAFQRPASDMTEPGQIKRCTYRRLALPCCCWMLALAGLLLVGCEKVATPTRHLATTTMKIGSVSFTLEIANRNEERYRGLMYRNSMPADHGMIFVFPDTAPRSFWMENTRIPLDILYLDDQGVVVSIHQMKPYDLSGVHSGKPAKYAIELNKGAAERAGVKVGDKLDIPEAARNGQ